MNIKKEPRKCTLITSSQSLVSIKSIFTSLANPALLTKTLGSPTLEIICSIADFISFSSATFAPIEMACPPFLMIESTVLKQASSVRSNTTTVNPSLANLFAIPAPMPCAAPVTIAIFLVKFIFPN
ncbi:hypothetical protein D3C85_1081840 [compost metagenome]